MVLNYIVMDLEFNQPFDFDDGLGDAVEPSCPFEIMQVGLVKLDADFGISKTMDLIIRPSIYKRVHPFVGKITGLTHNDIYTDTQTFPQSFEEIRTFIGSSDNVFAVWGGSDIKLLFKNMDYHGISSDGIPVDFIDVQKLASRHLNISAGMTIGLKNAVAAFDIDQDRPFHNALNDALYTARIFDIVRRGEENLTQHVNTFGAITEAGVLKRRCKVLSYDVMALYREMEKMFGRKLTASQKKIVRKVYEMGKNGKFDYSKKQ